MTQAQKTIEILYRYEKGALLTLEREFQGQVLEPGVARIVEQKREGVAELKRRLGKEKGAP